MRPYPHRRQWLLLAAAAATARPQGLNTTATAPEPAPLVHRITWDGARNSLVTHLQHQGQQPLVLLRWGTPFEDGWFAPWLRLWRDGVALPYQGAMLKRGEPEADDYLHLQPGQSQLARNDVSQAFDLRAPGHYRLQTDWRWHDAYPAGATSGPRPRAAHRPMGMPPLTLQFVR